jgi:RNA binding exosome subunit
MSQTSQCTLKEEIIKHDDLSIVVVKYIRSKDSDHNEYLYEVVQNSKDTNTNYQCFEYKDALVKVLKYYLSYLKKYPKSFSRELVNENLKRACSPFIDYANDATYASTPDYVYLNDLLSSTLTNSHGGIYITHAGYYGNTIGDLRVRVLDKKLEEGGRELKVILEYRCANFPTSYRKVEKIPYKGFNEINIVKDRLKDIIDNTSIIDDIIEMLNEVNNNHKVVLKCDIGTRIVVADMDGAKNINFFNIIDAPVGLRDNEHLNLVMHCYIFSKLDVLVEQYTETVSIRWGVAEDVPLLLRENITSAE